MGRPDTSGGESPLWSGTIVGTTRGRGPRSKGERVNTMTVVLFVVGLGLLVLGAEWLVKGASRLAAAWDLALS